MSVKYQKFKENYNKLLSQYSSHTDLVNDLATQQGVDSNKLQQLRSSYNDEELGQMLAYKGTDTSPLDEFLAGFKTELAGGAADIGTIASAVTGNEELASELYKKGSEYRRREGTSNTFTGFLKDPSLNKFLDYAGGVTGQAAGFMAPAAISGGLTSILGKGAAKAIGKKAIGNKLAKEAIKKETRDELISKAARTAGAGTIGAQSAGNIYGQQEEKDILKSVAGGSLMAALEYGLGIKPTNLPVFKRAFGGKVDDAVKQVTTKPSIKKAVGKAIATGGEEGLEEVLQTPVENYSVDSSFGTLEEYIEGAAAGATAGALLGAPGAAGTYNQQKQGYQEFQRVEEEAQKQVEEARRKEEQEREEEIQNKESKRNLMDSLLSKYNLSKEEMADTGILDLFNNAIEEGEAYKTTIDRERTPEEVLTKEEQKEIDNLEGQIRKLEDVASNPFEETDKKEDAISLIDEYRNRIDKIKNTKSEVDLQFVDNDGATHSLKETFENVFNLKQQRKQDEVERVRREVVNNKVLKEANKVFESRVQDADGIISMLGLDRSRITKRNPKKPKNNPYTEYSLPQLRQEMRKEQDEETAKKLKQAYDYQIDKTSKFVYLEEKEDGKVVEKPLEKVVKDKAKELKSNYKKNKSTMRNIEDIEVEEEPEPTQTETKEEPVQTETQEEQGPQMLNSDLKNKEDIYKTLNKIKKNEDKGITSEKQTKLKNGLNTLLNQTKGKRITKGVYSKLKPTIEETNDSLTPNMSDTDKAIEEAMKSPLVSYDKPDGSRGTVDVSKLHSGDSGHVPKDLFNVVAAYGFVDEVDKNKVKEFSEDLEELRRQGVIPEEYNSVWGEKEAKVEQLAKELSNKENITDSDAKALNKAIRNAIFKPVSEEQTETTNKTDEEGRKLADNSKLSIASRDNINGSLHIRTKIKDMRDLLQAHDLLDSSKKQDIKAFYDDIQELKRQGIIDKELSGREKTLENLAESVANYKKESSVTGNYNSEVKLLKEAMLSYMSGQDVGGIAEQQNDIIRRPRQSKKTSSEEKKTTNDELEIDEEGVEIECSNIRDNDNNCI